MTAAQITLIAGSVGAVVAALVAAGFSLLTTWIIKKADNEKAMRELIFKYALETYSHHIEAAKLKNTPTRMLPVEAYIVHIAAVANVLLHNRLTSKNICSLLDEVDSITSKSNDHLSETRETVKQRQAKRNNEAEDDL